MLVCPQCQSENPDSNKFCQQCGTSLTQKTCLDCGAQVPFEAAQCNNCGAVTAAVWWAIVSGRSTLDLNVAPAQPAIGLASTNSVVAGADSAPTVSPVSAADVVSANQYLDPGQRYRVLEVGQTDAVANEIQVKVLDCQPFQLSPLEILASQGDTDHFSDTEQTTFSGVQPTADVQVELSNAEAETLKAMGIPAIAHPYLTLQSKFYQTLPGLHDAWKRDGQEVVLLEDRSCMVRLCDLWHDEEIPGLQILHWFYEMADLWAALELWNCRQSLLELNNLRIDEDQALCLQRLYPETDPAAISLSHLGQVWQFLFDQSQRTQLVPIALLLADLQKGKIETIQELQSRIEAIAHELEVPNAASTDAAPLDLQPTDLDTSTADVSTSPVADLRPSVTPTQFDRQMPDLEFLLDSDETEPDASEDMPTVVLPMQLASLDYASCTDIGRQRDHNEDYFGIETQTIKLESPLGKKVHVRGVYILCDGMGGHAGGEVASALAVDTLKHYFRTHWQEPTGALARKEGKLPSADVIREAIRQANQAIYDINQENAVSGSGRMGTTLILVLVQDTEVAVAHVGDSRLYRYSRKRGLSQVTVDHEVGQREIHRGVEPAIAYARPDAYQLTQALGPRDENFISPDVQFFELNEDTLLLLCSDGLTDNDLLEEHWQTHLDPLLSSQANLNQGAEQLIQLANQYNGHDNITAIVIRAKVRPNLEQLHKR